METIYFEQIGKDVEVPFGWYVLSQDEFVEFGDLYYNYNDAKWLRCDNCGYGSSTRAKTFGSACIRDRRRFKNKVIIE